MQRSFKVEEWNVSLRQYPRAAKRKRTRRRQLCIKWRVDARAMSFHIRWASQRKSATLWTMVLALLDYRLMKHSNISITFKSELLLGQSKTSATAAGPWYSQCVACMVPSCMNMVQQRLVLKCGTAWVSRTSSKFHQAVMFALYLDQWQLTITGKVPSP